MLRREIIPRGIKGDSVTERFNELKDRAEVLAHMQHKGDETHLTSIRDMNDRMILPNIHLTGTPERKKMEERKYEEIMAENFPEMMENMNLQIKKTPSRIN